MRIRLATAAVCGLALVLPAHAFAGTASTSGSTVTVAAAPGETNRLAVMVDPDLLNLRITETGSGVTLTAGTGCSPGVGANKVLCPLLGTTLITMTGDNGNDLLTNSTAIPSNLDGGANDDVLTGGTGADTLTGSLGLDHADYSTRTLPITANLDGFAGDGQLGENDTVANDVEVLVGGSGVDNLTGNLNDNGLDGGPGADNLDGGLGNDYALYWNRTAGVNISLDGVANDGEPGENDSYTSIESGIGGDGPDTLTGDAGANDFYGWGSDDTIDGRGGADDMFGLDGIDTISYATHTQPLTVTLDGAAGDGAAGENDNAVVEHVVGGSGDDSLTGSTSVNSIDGGPGADVLDGGLGADALAGGEGIDRVNYALRAVPVTADIDGAADDGQAAEGDNIAADVENLTGGSGPDTLTGDGDANVLDGGTGADTLNGGSGTDTVTYASRTTPVTADIDGSADDGEAAEGDDIATDIENLTGGTGTDTLTGDPDANLLDGGAGADVLNGGGGTDTATYASRTAPVTADIDGAADDGEAAEGDNVATDVENLTGGSGGDTLTGNASTNRLDGGPDADTLNGGAGTDTLIGAAGADGFLARDGADDQMSCGSEADTVAADPGDDADADCEDVDTGPTASVPPAATTKAKAKATATPKIKAKASKVKISTKPITLGPDGSAPVLIACPKSQVGGCAGTVKIDIAAAAGPKGKAKSSRRSRRRTVLGRKKFKVAAGKKKTIRVRMSRRGRRRVLRKRRIRCRVSVVNKGQNGKTVTTKLHVSLNAPKLKVPDLKAPKTKARK